MLATSSKKMENYMLKYGCVFDVYIPERKEWIIFTNKDDLFDKKEHSDNDNILVVIMMVLLLMNTVGDL